MRAVVPLVGLAIVTGYLLGLVATSPGARAGRVPDLRPAVPHAAVAAETAVPAVVPAPVPGTSVDFASVVARVNPAVVSVDTAARESDDRSRLILPRRFPEEVREGSGSGFVIDPSGLILTNYHVVNDADRVTVTIGDGRTFRATIVGVDPEIDIALLQVAVREPLATLPFGRSSELRVGEWVCAIGNPLGYPHSVTVGVVSFLGRKLFDLGLDALIQTDAAITFGNSGGPLINARGQVVGVTAAISSQAANIGFAVPIDQVVAVLDELRDVGRVARGSIGAGVTSVTPAVRHALGLEPLRGALVQDVGADTPAERVGLRPYDVITGLNGRAVQSDDELVRGVSSHRPGTLVEIEYWRDGDRRTVQVKLTERPLSPSARQLTSARGVQPARRDDVGLGLRVVDIDGDQARRKGLPPDTPGVLITNVDSAGPARTTAIREGQVLLEVNRKRVDSAAEYRALTAALRPGTPVALLVFDPALRQRIIFAFVTDLP